MAIIKYRTVDVDGLKIFYREAGASDAPKLLLLHGFPSAFTSEYGTLRRFWDAGFRPSWTSVLLHSESLRCVRSPRGAIDSENMIARGNSICARK